jgi:uncharacterized protein YuzE
VSRILEGRISVPKNHGERVSIELDKDGKVNLVVSFSTKPEIQSVDFHLNLVRYEFLCRVGEGTLPSSFSRECYEDVLSFKTQLLRQFENRRNIELDMDDLSVGYIALDLIDLDSDGKINIHAIEVLI